MERRPPMETYPWSPIVVAALLELDPALLQIRIAEAERAITERLSSNEELDFDERLRLRDARDVLGDLKKGTH
jgi:hypothetical protein